MKNLTYYPFSRNRYFNGKLLTAQDFEQEQRYMNDKRRLINRWILGFGVAAGLEVVQIDDYSVSLEMGLAFDRSGREIFVETPVILKLSLLDGYEEATREEGNESLYLCMEYSQSEAEPVHNIHNDAVHVGGQMENSKYTEGYHLYVTDDEPEGETEEFSDEVGYIAKRAEKIGHGTYQRGIYLARILLVKAGDFYMIDRIIGQPFKQYVFNLPLTAGILKEIRQDVKALGQILEAEAMTGETRGRTGNEQAAQGDWQLEEGVALIPIPETAAAKEAFYSAQIPHGLGPGNTEMLLRILDGGFTYGGVAGIFPADHVTAEAAFRLNREDGTFVIGIRLLAGTKEREIRVGWTAIRSRGKNEFLQGEARLFIAPSMVTMKVREEISLSVVCVNMEEKGVNWRVVQPEGGSVEENGRYHAPGYAGVYEIEAVSILYPSVRNTVFAIVREN